MKFKKSLIVLLLLLFYGSIFSQSATFDISIEPLNIPDLSGVQSYAFGQHHNKWLIVGGRTEGLHQRLPFSSFQESGKNKQLIVIDPESKQKWTTSLVTLSKDLQDQLGSSNMQFYQSGNFLYLLGGYGLSNISNEHISFGKLTAINVSGLIEAIIKGSQISSFFRQISDSHFAVTGGRLEKMYETYYLVGGQKFTGRYNPMGPNMGPGFIQEYTNQIRKFNIKDDGVTLRIEHYKSETDSVNLHRRDFNVVPQISSTGQEMLTAFSGVFQHDRDLPFLNAVNIESTGFKTDDLFTQYYNHYHCANIPLYNSVNKEMHTLFFGGIAQFYDEDGMLVQNNNVPFVKTISRVTRNAKGVMAEYKLPIEMPSFLGSASEFIKNEDLPQHANGVIKLDELTADTVLLGYIFGGIKSTAENIFWVNDGSQSQASNQILKVNLIKNKSTVTHKLNEQSVGTLKIRAIANPDTRNFTVRFNLSQKSDVKISISDKNGKKIEEKTLTGLPVGENLYRKAVKDLDKGGIYFLTVETSFEKSTHKIVVEL